jgi:simple sugar transport system ATP-binding protein
MQIASQMVGREMLPEVHKPAANPGDPVLVVRDLEVESDRGVLAVRGVSFEVRKGEILGIAGVEGNGQSELIEALTGLRPARAGSATVNGIQLLNASASANGRRPPVLERLSIKPRPARVRESGVAFVPEDRRERGLVLPYTVADNLILGQENSPRFARAGVLQLGRIRQWARKLVREYDVRPPRVDVPAGNLSGGNQQKVVVAREFSEDPALLIASQPTRGVDIGATQFVHERLVEKRDAGAAVLLLSAELDEILELSDRIAVIYEGQVMAVFNSGEATEEQIGLLMTGGTGHQEAPIDVDAPALSQGT